MSKKPHSSSMDFPSRALQTSAELTMLRLYLTKTRTLKASQQWLESVQAITKSMQELLCPNWARALTIRKLIEHWKQSITVIERVRKPYESANLAMFPSKIQHRMSCTRWAGSIGKTWSILRPWWWMRMKLIRLKSEGAKSKTYSLPKIASLRNTLLRVVDALLFLAFLMWRQTGWIQSTVIKIIENTPNLPMEQFNCEN